jgi:septal ring-binding cell division protein DamX
MDGQMSSVYQSPGDKMRYEILVKSLIEGRLNLAVLSESDLTLDFYANAIHDDLRARGERMVEFCFSADSAKLVEMFNGILSELTVSQARDKQVKSAPKRYLIFRDIMAMQEFELQLLARLVNGFPASNINVVLLVNSSASHTSKLQTFGKNLLSWEVEGEPGQVKAEAPEPRGWAKSAEREPWLAPAEPSATPITKPASPAKVAASPEAPRKDEGPLAPDLGNLSPKEIAAEDGATDPWVPAQAPPPRKGLVWALAVVLISLVAFGFMYSDLLMQEFAALNNYINRTPAPAAAPVAPVASVGMATSVPAPPINPTESLGDKEEIIDTKQAAPTEAAPPVAPLPAPPAPAPAPEKVAAETKAEALKTAAEAAKPKPEVAKSSVSDKAAAATQGSSQDGANWARQLPEKSFVLQHAAFDALDDALAAQNKSPALANALLLMASKKNGAKYFIIVTGPYENRVAAEGAMKAEPAFAKSWMRSAQSVKQQYAAL